MQNTLWRRGVIVEDETNVCAKIFFPQPLWSRWPGVTLTMHTMLVDEKPADLCPLFMDAHNSKVPLSALLNAGALTFYGRTWTILWCSCKMALHRSSVLRRGGPWHWHSSNVWSQKLAELLIKWSWHRVATALWSHKSDVGETGFSCNWCALCRQVSSCHTTCWRELAVVKMPPLSVGTGHI